MVKFSSDVDILKYEPALFGELHLPWQVVCAGTDGALSGTTFTAASADFVSAGVEAGGVIYMRSADGALDGGYEIVSVDSATQVTVSVVRADSQAGAVAPPGASEVSYHVGTFSPQAGEAAFQLTEYFGIRPGNPASSIGVEDILDAEVFRRVSAFAVISSVYAMLASRAADENFWAKSLHYKKLFEKAKERCQLGIDLGGDGVVDLTRAGASIRLARD